MQVLTGAEGSFDGAVDLSNDDILLLLLGVLHGQVIPGWGQSFTMSTPENNSRKVLSLEKEENLIVYRIMFFKQTK